MAEWAVEIRGLDELRRRLDPALIGQALERALERSALVMQSEAKRQITQMGAVDTGRLRASITHRLEGEGQGRFAVVGTNVFYAPYVHEGRKPGKMPPPRALLEWVHRHKLAGTYSPQSRRRRGSAYQQYWEDLEVAFMIARKIMWRGIKARPFLRQALEASRPRIASIFRGEFERLWRR